MNEGGVVKLVKVERSSTVHILRLAHYCAGVFYILGSSQFYLLRTNISKNFQKNLYLSSFCVNCDGLLTGPGVQMWWIIEIDIIDDPLWKRIVRSISSFLDCKAMPAWDGLLFKSLNLFTCRVYVIIIMRRVLSLRLWMSDHWKFCATRGNQVSSFALIGN